MAEPIIPIAGIVHDEQMVHFNVGSQAPDMPSFTIERAREGALGSMPFLNVNFRVGAPKRVELEKDYGCTIHSVPYGLEPKDVDTLVALAYLEGIAFSLMDTKGGPPHVNCVSPLLLQNPVAVDVSYHVVPNGFVPIPLTQRCECVCASADPVMCDKVHDYVFFGTSIGNLDLDAVLTLMVRTRRQVGFAVFPVVKDIAGRVTPTLHYHHSRPGVVTWTNHDHRFHTVDPHYLEDGYFFLPQADVSVHQVVGLRSTLLQNAVSGFALYELSLYSPGIEYLPEWRDDPEQFLWKPEIDGDGEEGKWSELADVSKYQTFATTSAGNQSTSAFNWAAVNVSHITYASAWVCFTSPEKRRILFSRAVAFKGLTIFRNRPRTPELLTTITRWVTSEYARFAFLPDEVKYYAQSATDLYIYVRVGFETDMLQTHIATSRVRLGQHKELVAMRAPTSLTKEKLIGGGLFFGLTSYVAHVGDVTVKSFVHAGNAMAVMPSLHTPMATSTSLMVKHAAFVKATAVVAGSSATFLSLPAAIGVWAAVAGVGLAYNKIREHTNYATVVDQWRNANPDENPPALSQGVYTLPPGITFGATNVIKRDRPPQDPTSVILPPTKRVEKEPTNKVKATGLCFQITPRYMENTVENQEIALMSRLSLATPPPRPGLWALVVTVVLQTELYRLQAEELSRENMRFSLTKNTVINYGRRYPRSHAEALVDGYEKFVDQGRTLLEDDYRTSMFIKGELHNKPAFDDANFMAFMAALATPRGIISYKAIINAVFGPFVDHVYSSDKALRLRLLKDPDSPGPLFAFAPAGACGEDIALWVARVVDHFGGAENVVAIETDDVKYDAHNSVESRVGGRRLGVGMVKGREAPKLLALFEKQDTIRGTSVGGVKYKVVGKTGSGQSDTSCSNTKKTEAKTAYALSREPGDIIADAGTNYFIAANGDDMYALVGRAWFDKRFEDGDPIKTLGVRNTRLGFEIEAKIHVGKVGGTFCSRYFYPVGGKYLPGGKIGRTLAKAGYFYETKDSQSIYSAAIGQLQDNHHVPFLKEYFSKVVELCRKQKLALRGKPNEYSIHMREKHDYDESTCAYVNELYGLTAQDLDEFKELLDKVTTLPVLISWPKLEHLLAVDMK